MIRLEYDQQTAGVRISFVVQADDASMTTKDLDIQAFCKQGISIDGKWEIPQNSKTLKTVKVFLERVIEHE